ncbi:MAG: FtsK/SpoIIIE domain-containing protein, partial [Acutalibacteraceae bacterium]|nr:FtsK/SpoIIIE domain-containing protein [Acutalibacteraceae bacterium]
MEKIKNYKYLPHVNELFEDASQFVFDEKSAAIAFGKLQAIMGERTKKSEDDDSESSTKEQYTQIVCIVFDDYDIKETGFSKYLPQPPVQGKPYVNTNGLTFVFACRDLAQLPRYCGNIIEVTDDTESHAKVSSQYNVLSRETLNNLSKSGSQASTTSNIENLIDYKKFSNHFVFYDENQSRGLSIKNDYKDAFRRLSAIYYRRIAENGNVPSMVTLFEMYGYKPEMISDNQIKDILIESWQKSDVTKNLAVPIGKNEHGIVELDLYEKADGPHMLVAGTTGSGKSETIITYLIGLCMKYSPTYLNLMLVDMKGGSFSNRLRELPHCVGVVDDTAGESEGISAVYMLKRFLAVLNAEIKRRKILLNKFGVDTVDAYIKAEIIITKILNGDTSEDQLNALNDSQKIRLQEYREKGEKPETLSHLVLVVDEFTELKRFSSESDDIDFITEITTIARVGRTLGFHIVLVSQNIEGAITEDIRINSKSRICLKVATRAASKEMLDGRPDAASPTMPGNGRAYLLVGTGSRFMYFQSAYTGANKDEKIEPTVTAVQVSLCGSHNKKYYVSNKHNKRIKRASKKVSEGDTQLSYIISTIQNITKCNENETIFRNPRVIFKNRLKSKYSDPTQWR